MLRKPDHNEYPEYYQSYIDSLPEQNILDLYKSQTDEVVNLFNSFSEEKLLYRYENEKWSIKELLAHLLDAEIIMGYRALTYARKDKTDLPMYDHGEYVEAGNFDKLDSQSLIKHYIFVRNSNLLLFQSFDNNIWFESGITGGKKFTTRTIPYIVSGHTKHHLEILKERYL